MPVIHQATLKKNTKSNEDPSRKLYLIENITCKNTPLHVQLPFTKETPLI